MYISISTYMHVDISKYTFIHTYVYIHKIINIIYIYMTTRLLTTYDRSGVILQIGGDGDACVYLKMGLMHQCM